MLRNEIESHITATQRKQKKRYDKARRAAKQYEEGELVLI